MDSAATVCRDLPMALNTVLLMDGPSLLPSIAEISAREADSNTLWVIRLTESCTATIHRRTKMRPYGASTPLCTTIRQSFMFFRFLYYGGFAYPCMKLALYSRHHLPKACLPSPGCQAITRRQSHRRTHGWRLCIVEHRVPFGPSWPNQLFFVSFFILYLEREATHSRTEFDGSTEPW